MAYTTQKNIFESFPPFFRPAEQQGDELGQTSSTDSDSTSSISIPEIDFQGMAPEILGPVCREWGMFRLVNHGVPKSLLTQLHQKSQEIFQLGYDSKLLLLREDPVLYFWGSPAIALSGNFKQQISGDNLSWLECLSVPLEKSSKSQYQDPLLESFRSLVVEYGYHQTRIAKAIYKTIAEDLEFPAEKETSNLSTSSGSLRVYRYPRCLKPDLTWGIKAHTDSSVLSILHQDEVGGLQVCKDDTWIDVKPIPDTLIVNIGDIIQAMSNDEYLSVTHRVKVNRLKERISIGYFVFSANDAVIESSKYRPFTFDEFQAQNKTDLENVGWKVGLPRFRKD